MRPFHLHCLLALMFSLSACDCGPGPTEPEDDAGTTDAGADAGPPRTDAGRQPIDDEVWLQNWATEPCPAEVFSTDDGGYYEPVDGGFRFGLCVVLHQLETEVRLNGLPETEPIETYFVAGSYRSELRARPASGGLLTMKVLRSRYDNLRHQPGGVWPNFKGYIEHGFIDMREDQQRDLFANSYLLRGGVRYGGLPFVPSPFPEDVWFNGFGAPAWQMSMVSSAGGAYELKLLEGAFTLFLSTPAASLYGTELRDYNVNPGRYVQLSSDSELDIDIPTAVLDATLTVDGAPLPDVRPGPDFSLSYTRTGDNATSVYSRHEGGVASLTALVPQGIYGVAFDFEGVPNRSFPVRISGKQLGGGINLTHDNTVSVNFDTFPIEMGVIIDGRAPPTNPAYNLGLYLFASSTETSGRGALFYELPLSSPSFAIRAMPGLYFAVMAIDSNLAPNLASGFWIVNRQFEHYGPNNMVVSINTVRFSGRIFVDGKAPLPNRGIGQLSFRNRSLEGQWSWFQAGLVPSEDGAFEVRLPSGVYDVYLELDPGAYPEYAIGRHLMATVVNMETDRQLDLNYNTVELSGPLRVDGKPVEDRLPGPEYGLVMVSQSGGETFSWRSFHGGDRYSVRLPVAQYEMYFAIYENGFESTAWGQAPMGYMINLAPVPGRPFLDFRNY